MKASRATVLAPLLGLAMLAAACSSSSTAATPSGSSSSGEAGTKTFSIASPPIGLSTVPLLAALDDMRAKGYTIDAPVVSSVDLVAQGVASGQFAFGSGGNSTVLSADAAGADIVVVVDRSGNETGFWGVSSITDCAGLGGKRVALTSAGSVSTYMISQYIASNCAGTKPGSYLNISGSDNKMAALLAGQVDAAPMDLDVTVTLSKKGGDKFRQITNFAESLPNLRTNSVFTSSKFAKANPKTVKDLISALLDEFQKIKDQDGYLQTLAKKYAASSVDASTLDAAAALYRKLNLFPVDGGLTDANVAYTANFFGPDVAKAVKSVVPSSQWADLSYLKAVIAQRG